jgi:hypothetical protein
MAKKQVGVSLRKPPPVDVDSFVHAAANETPAVLEMVKKPGADVVVTTDAGRELREMTVYLPVDLARKMSMHCVEKDRDVSNLVAEAITTHLTPKPAPKPVRVEVKPTKRSLADWGRMLRARLAF